MTTATVYKKSLTRQDYKSYLQKGVSYQQYKQQIAEDQALNVDLKKPSA
jgi:hypothetical protein